MGKRVICFMVVLASSFSYAEDLEILELERLNETKKERELRERENKGFVLSKAMHRFIFIAGTGVITGGGSMATTSLLNGEPVSFLAGVAASALSGFALCELSFSLNKVK